ncbi:hypothetical protein [Nostoc favosum]|uniref:Uncharacterized protein n=1 Tax=Nostoc favosum CHAB5714 TaxID=2780399 RepID=A0ABS8IHQ9_9NOSO|nr:hypothetical protein [Nostoc favosum]MCC5603052.1 hypothetical protein [Nostoc favosum CHAB5714]
MYDFKERLRYVAQVLGKSDRVCFQKVKLIVAVMPVRSLVLFSKTHQF